MNLVVFFLGVSSASSELVERDWREPGDGLILVDTDTGLEWLKLSASTGLSYEQVEDNVGGFISNGWRHGTGPEVCALWEAIEAATVPCPGGFRVSGGRDYMRYLGVTCDDGFQDVRSNGLYEDLDGIASHQGLARIESFGAGCCTFDIQDDDEHITSTNSCTGHYLTRPAPEPRLVLAALLLVPVLWLLRAIHPVQPRPTSGAEAAVVAVQNIPT